MPTKDSGKSPSRRRGATTGKSPESSAQISRPGTRKPSSSQKPTSRVPRRRASSAPTPPSITAPVPLEPLAQGPHEEAPTALAEPGAAEMAVERAEPVTEQPPSTGEAEIEAARAGPIAVGEAVGEAEHDEGSDETEGGVAPDGEPPRRRDRRGAGTNALGIFIERQFANPTSPAHSYSDLERHSRISREALSRYVTARADRRRSPTIDTLVAIADALHVSLEAVARAAAASVKGVIPPPEDVQHAREETLGALVAALSDEQFSAVVELLRQMRPPPGE